MVLRHAAEMQERLRKMLTKDKIGNAGFVSALKRDVGRVLKDYFELSDEPELTVAVNADGGYAVTVSARADDIRRFRTTESLPRPEM